MTTISLRLDEQDSILIKNYAKAHNISISELVRQAVMEKIEDEMDIHLYNQAMSNYQQNPETFSFDTVVKELGLNDQ
ncbi:CopG family transcriptional regulator (plasmid) [Lysinibacillus macroides]|uniref:type II toxin-antitoxin system RelB family antitoxin n=1 Tax=Lysinibacillus macroides TaxID=33935 RepID=UPI001935C157|nr:CopG family transcriptional regulator [Lysinibacillus macroides]